MTINIDQSRNQNVFHWACNSRDFNYTSVHTASKTYGCNAHRTYVCMYIYDHISTVSNRIWQTFAEEWSPAKTTKNRSALRLVNYENREGGARGERGRVCSTGAVLGAGLLFYKGKKREDVETSCPRWMSSPRRSAGSETWGNCDFYSDWFVVIVRGISCCLYFTQEKNL